MATTFKIMDINDPENNFEEPFDFCQRDKDLKWNGWGWKDSYFFINDRYCAEFTGNRYEICGKQLLQLPLYMEASVKASLSNTCFPEEKIKSSKIPKPILCENFINWLKERKLIYTIDGMKRVNRSHGHTVEDMVKLRLGECEERIPDIVVFPKNHDEVVDIVKTANAMNCVIIPIGGGTSVSSALKCPLEETRCIISLDVCRMNRILYIDEKNLIARAECGILGGDLEQQLNKKGYTIGHEPDSIEFSSLGGWVATRASGIKKNKYGNIEDLLIHVTFVTPSGVVEKACTSPRISCGPDIHHFILGSEGTLGVITEVTFKICELPKCKKFGAILFPTFEHGIKMLREVARQKCAPTSIRLMDNEQFKFGQSLKPIPSVFGMILDHIKMFYVTKLRRFDSDLMSPATLLFEGSTEEVQVQQKRINKLAEQFGGIVADSESGRYGYMLTFSIAYLRDIAMNYCALGESFETSAPWDKVSTLCQRVKETCVKEAYRLGIRYPPYVCCRVTQLYDAGACIYFYFGFNYLDIKRGDFDESEENDIIRALHIYEEIEVRARNEILACGGSISHHHGVGKIRKRWLPETIGQVGLGAMQAVKEKLDPKNIFACGNLFTAKSKI